MRRVSTVIQAVMCLVVHAGCTEVSGGAVELSWKLRSASGGAQDFLDCDSGLTGTGPIKQIRLAWETGYVMAHHDFTCTAYHGVTGFDLPPGQALLSVSPICASGPADTHTYIAPAPEQRTVIVGNTINLEAIELILEVPTATDPTCATQMCICQ